MSRILTKLSQAFDLGVVTTTMICLTLAATYVIDQFTTADLRLPLRLLDVMCVIVLLIWQFRRVRQSRQHDRMLKAILDAVPHILFFKDARLRYREINTVFEHTFGVEADRVKGLSDRDLFGEDLQRRFSSQDRELLRDGQMRTYDEDMLVRGELRQIRSSKRPVYDQDGHSLGVVGLAIDVTDQNRLQQELRDAHTRLNIALQAACMGVWDWDLDTDQIQADDVTRTLLHLGPDDHEARVAFSRMHPEDAERVRTLAVSALHSHEPVEYEFRVLDDDGVEHWIEGFATSLSACDKPNYLIGINRDITERRRSKQALDDARMQAEQSLHALEQSRINLDMALRAGGLGVWHSDAEVSLRGAIIQPALLAAPVSGDEAALAIGGFAPGMQLTYRDYIQAIHPDDRDRVIAAFERIDGEGTHVYSDQYRVVRPDGSVRTLDVRASVTILLAADHRLVSVTGIIKDVTVEETLKADLAAKAEEARLARDAKSRFLAMMSHEVRTPMNGVLGMLDLVIDTPLTPDQRHMLSSCRRSARALLTIVNDILDFSKIEAGKLDLESTSLSLSSLIEDVCSAFYPPARQKKVQLTVKLDASMPRFMMGDPVRLRQILTNLLNNAIKFTDHGQVQVRALVCESDRWALEVEDSGPGISPPALAQLFQPFHQADASTTRRFGGTGLGLSIVKQLAELMGGTVDCRSEVGYGSCFRVVLPLQPWLPAMGSSDREGTGEAEASPRDVCAEGRGFESAEPTEQTAAVNPLTLATPALPPKRFLIAEDNPINQEIIVRQLRRMGHSCECAEDGEQAWAMLQAPGATYDALITDGNMPRLDGYGLAERIRAWEHLRRTPQLPILAMTANALQGERERCLVLGMNGYISKPLDPVQLRRELYRLFMPEVGFPAPSPSTDLSERETSREYTAVRKVCADDPTALRQVLTTFVAILGEDVASLERAHCAGDVKQLRYLAHKMGSGCLQLGEVSAQQALLLIEDAVDLAQVLDAYPKAEVEVQAALSRAWEFLRRSNPDEGR